ncbi:hypothetical protein PC9H_009233 [Pleurotus ostreatus]|uniref:Uncharacterized protein n=1 Tax=Pleurotus ostreatus TaxID=5322 RepID=A0A8H6ZT80_PLEOS|nr:uncharacterized protein PC9H_009233 [Pleurotus ostreatus]KAF7423935.1 hypothetical protein PC9H_009233 [Pleurotus ostreatus]
MSSLVTQFRRSSAYEPMVISSLVFSKLDLVRAFSDDDAHPGSSSQGFSIRGASSAAWARALSSTRCYGQSPLSPLPSFLPSSLFLPPPFLASPPNASPRLSASTLPHPHISPTTPLPSLCHSATLPLLSLVSESRVPVDAYSFSAEGPYIHIVSTSIRDHRCTGTQCSSPLRVFVSSFRFGSQALVGLAVFVVPPTDRVLRLTSRVCSPPSSTRVSVDLSPGISLTRRPIDNLQSTAGNLQ